MAATETRETLSEPIKIRFDKDVLAFLEREAATSGAGNLNFVVRKHLRESVARKQKAAARKR